MERQQTLKLSSLSDEEIGKILDMMSFESDTEEEDLENDSDDDDSDMKCQGFDEAISKAVNMSDSMLVSEICVTSSGSPSSVANLLSPTTIASNTICSEICVTSKESPASMGELLSPSTYVSNITRSRKRKRSVPTEQNVIQPDDSISRETGEFIGSVSNIDPKSDTFKKILWRQKNLLLNNSAIAFSQPELGEELKSLIRLSNVLSTFLATLLLSTLLSKQIYMPPKKMSKLPSR